MDQQIFLQAVKNPWARPGFIAGLNLEDVALCIKEVKYLPDGGNPEQNMDCKPHWRAVFGTIGTKSTINIYPSAFSPNNHESIEDFLSSLIDRQGFFATRYYADPTRSLITVNKLESWNPYAAAKKLKEIQIRMEWEAYENQFNNLRRRNCSGNYIDRVMDGRQKYRKIVGVPDNLVRL